MPICPWHESATIPFHLQARNPEGNHGHASTQNRTLDRHSPRRAALDDWCPCPGRDRILAIHVRAARPGDRRADQAVRGRQPGHQGQAHARSVRRLPREDRRGDPGEAGTGRRAAFLRLAARLSESGTAAAAAGQRVQQRRDREGVLSHRPADEDRWEILCVADRRPLARAVLEQVAVQGSRARSEQAARRRWTSFSTTRRS